MDNFTPTGTLDADIDVRLLTEFEGFKENRTKEVGQRWASPQSYYHSLEIGKVSDRSANSFLQ